MVVSLFLVCYALLHMKNVHASELNSQEVCFVVLTQVNQYHEALYQKLEKDILKQAELLNLFSPSIFRSYDLQDGQVGHWTIFPLLEKLSSYEDFKWVFFIEESSRVNVRKLLKVFERYNSSEEVFVGNVLQDNDPTIIHHFADPSSLSYPHFSAGFFISPPVLRRFASRLPLDEEYSFSIDPKYEFAKFVWDNGNGVKLQHESQFCLTKTSENCATWIEEEFPNCGLPLPVDKLHVGVKTCHKFHADRISVVKNTWASESNNVRIFSDREDDSVPTIQVDVENVAHGHCEKTFFIFHYYLKSSISLQWLAIVDDDTIISIERLRKLLSCYNASDAVIIGERYGYGVANSVGYDYITGGGGMIFSHSAMQQLVEHCECPFIDSPDDMIIGLCFKRLGIHITHSPHFHQARPIDYSLQFLAPLKHVSFHKHWMINPYNVFHDWLQEAAPSHTEL